MCEGIIPTMLTEQQRIDRRKGLGGSDVAVILGLSNYSTPLQLFLEKTGKTPIAPEKKESDVQYWGNVMEPILVQEFRRRNNNIKVSFPKDTIVHPLFDFMRANLDGYIDDWEMVLETKTADCRKAYEWGADGSDIVPLEYLVQVVHYCLTTNSKGAKIVVLIGGNDYRELTYNRDTELENKILSACCDFWSAVQKDIAPEPVNINDLKLMYPQHKVDKVIHCDNDNVLQKVLGLQEIKTKEKELNALEKEYRFEIMHYMQDGECLVDTSGTPLITWKTNARGSRTFLVKNGRE